MEELIKLMDNATATYQLGQDLYDKNITRVERGLKVASAKLIAVSALVLLFLSLALFFIIVGSFGLAAWMSSMTVHPFFEHAGPAIIIAVFSVLIWINKKKLFLSIVKNTLIHTLK
ncbi:MAG: hypothetical protein AAFR14_12685 [Bacteroidota bacterium]